MEESKPSGRLHYRKTPNGSEIEGMDIFIDENTQKLCEAYNHSSGATRSVLYVLLIVSIISLIATFNSNWRFNWNNERIALKMRTIFKDQLAIKKDEVKIDGIKNPPAKSIQAAYRSRFQDSLKWDSIKLEYDKKMLEPLMRSMIENDNTVKVSFIGITIDINDLASISGLTLIILLIILRFTVTREKHNLKIAFNSINERYNDMADYFKFKKIIDEEVYVLNDFTIEKPKTDEEWRSLIQDLNFVRRRYHYNYLSMNEVFNLPLLDTNRNDLPESWFEKLIKRIINKYLFYFFLIIYSYTIFNDFCSVDKAVLENPFHTIVILGLSLICFGLVFNITQDCVEHKKIVTKLFRKFWENDYKYDYANYMTKNFSGVYRILRPFVLIVIIYLLSLLCRNTSVLSISPKCAQQILEDIFFFKIK